MLEWTTEEKVLMDIKKIIAAAWRMNSQQLHAYYKKLCKKCPEILPGYLGRAFLQKLDEISMLDLDARTKIWPELLRDADWLLKLIQKHRIWMKRYGNRHYPDCRHSRIKHFGQSLAGHLY